jgi:threonine dehydrogenase-like Zn-dependent dehydrogenase
VRVRCAGICGTDLALYSGTYAADLPMVPGHEFAGTVQQVADPQDSRWIGARVTAEINNTCLSWNSADPCSACRAGIPTHCSERTVLGIVGCDGALAEIVRVPVRNLHPLPESMPFHYGTFVEPVAAAIQTFELTPIQAGNTVAVLGVGRLGVLICKIAALKGARVIAVARSPYKLQLARKFGAHVLLDTTEQDVAAQVRGLTGGSGADIVVDATGSPEGMDSAFELVRPQGTICVKSTPGTDNSSFPLTRAVVDEIRIQGSRCGPFGKAIRLTARHNLDMDVLVSQVFPLSNAAAALDAAQRKFKILVDMES